MRIDESNIFVSLEELPKHRKEAIIEQINKRRSELLKDINRAELTMSRAKKNNKRGNSNGLY